VLGLFFFPYCFFVGSPFDARGPFALSTEEGVTLSTWNSVPLCSFVGSNRNTSSVSPLVPVGEMGQAQSDHYERMAPVTLPTFFFFLVLSRRLGAPFFSFPVKRPWSLGGSPRFSQLSLVWVDVHAPPPFSFFFYSGGSPFK